MYFLTHYKNFTLKLYDGYYTEFPVIVEGYLKRYRIKKGDTVIDAGAYLGAFALIASQLVGDKGTVIAFEPDEDNFKKLLNNIKLNKATNITAINKGLWSKETILKFNNTNSGDSSFFFEDVKRDAIIDRPVVTLDGELKRLGIKRVDFVKMDIEGAEIEALKGCDNLLKAAHVKFAIASYHVVHGQKTCLELEKIFHSFGYKAETFLPEHSTTYAYKQRDPSFKGGRVWQKLVLSLLSLVIFLLISEIIVRKFYDFSQVVKVTFKGDLVLRGRLLGEGGFFKLSNDPVLLYEWVTLPQDVILKKQKHAFRVIVLGDSITYRTMWTLNDYYPKLLEDLLNASSPHPKYEIINAGMPGYNTSQEVRYFEKKWLPYLPDLVIVGYGTANDRTIKRKIVKFEDGLYCSDVRESYPYIALLPSRANKFLLNKSALYRFMNLVLVNVFEKLQLNQRRIRYFDSTFETETSIKKIKEISLKNKFDLLFVIFPTLSPGPEYEEEWIVDKCKKYDIKYIKLRNVFKMKGYENLKISEDDFCHPNQLGQQLAAKAIFDYFKDHYLGNH